MNFKDFFKKPETLALSFLLISILLFLSLIGFKTLIFKQVQVKTPSNFQKVSYQTFTPPQEPPLFTKTYFVSITLDAVSNLEERFIVKLGEKVEIIFNNLTSQTLKFEPTLESQQKLNLSSFEIPPLPSPEPSSPNLPFEEQTNSEFQPPMISFSIARDKFKIDPNQKSLTFNLGEVKDRKNKTLKKVELIIYP